MVQFTRVADGLYTASSNDEKLGWWGFVITRELEKPPTGSFSLQDALTNDEWKGTLVYVADRSVNILENVSGFVQRIGAILTHHFNDGALVLLPSGEVDEIAETTKTVIPLSRTGGQITPNSAFNATLTGVSGVDADINPQVALTVPPEADDTYILFTPIGAGPAITLGGRLAPGVGIPPDDKARLHFSGPANGAFTFSLRIGQTSLSPQRNTTARPQLDMGFQLVIPNHNTEQTTNGEKAVRELSAPLPLAVTGPHDPTTVGFSAQVNVLNPNNRVAGASITAFYFTGENGPGSTQPNTELVSYYRTNYGKTIHLTPVVSDSGNQQPAGLVINPGYAQTPLQNGFRFSPVGDFTMAVEGAEPGEVLKLLCGLSGTETIAFLPEIPEKQAGTRLRFVRNRPANVSQFPLQAASPVGPPIDPKASLLDRKYETSWAAIVAPPSDAQRAAHYTAAPRGAELFGKGTATVTGLLGPEDPGLSLPTDGSVVFPMFPLAGFKSGGEGILDLTPAQMELLARQIVGPTRKNAISPAGGNGKTTLSASSSATLFPDVAAATDEAGDGLTNTTTPTGFITRYEAGSGEWKQLLLSQVQDPAGTVTRQMGFTDLQDELQSAFQTPDQFLVVANNAYLGSPAAPPPPPPPGPPDWYTFMPPSSKDITGENYFFNQINIGKWNFAVQAGAKNRYGDYRSVMIVKGVQGKIFDYDPTTGTASDHSLVKSPDAWTMKDVFAAPSVEDEKGRISAPQLSQLIPLSSWLVQYCQNAYDRRDNPYFANFVRIIQDENWHGVLILKAAIEDIPPELAGIAVGVKDPADFYVHHIGIEIGQIDKDKVQLKSSTSMFGLVYYVDPRYDDSPEPHAIAPSDLSATFDFTLLTLKALFENSAIKKFESLAQMVLNRLFGSTVDRMGDGGNIFNGVLLQGGVQKNGDAVIYSLASRTTNRYSLANNVLTGVEIDTAQMSTRDDGSKSGHVVSWIGMSGFMNLAVIPGSEKDGLPPFDIFSFGAEDADSTEPRQGLNFNNLGLEIAMPAEMPGENGDEQPVTAALSLVEHEIAFNTDSSTPREESIYRSFQLELLGMLSGQARAEAEQDRSDPKGLGYLTVATQYGLQGVTSGSGNWHALRFKVNLGTPGALAGKVNLDSSLLVAWADDSGAGEGQSGFQAMVGIELPGTGTGGDLFSLQTVIKLSIGAIQLFYTPGDEQAKKPGGFLLLLNEIALKILGLAKIPPSGNTAFFLFGNKDVAESTGLGWFAIYNTGKKADQQSEAAARSA